MIKSELDSDMGVLIVCLTGPLAVADFDTLAEEFSAAVGSHARLRGLLIDVPHFPQWEGLSGIRAHLRFIATHHRRIRRVAIVTDNLPVRLAPLVACFALHPSVRHFVPPERTAALNGVSAA